MRFPKLNCGGFFSDLISESSSEKQEQKISWFSWKSWLKSWNFAISRIIQFFVFLYYLFSVFTFSYSIWLWIPLRQILIIISLQDKYMSENNTYRRAQIWNLSSSCQFDLPRVAEPQVHGRIPYFQASAYYSVYFINTNTNDINWDSIFTTLKENKQAQFKWVNNWKFCGNNMAKRTSNRTKISSES